MNHRKQDDCSRVEELLSLYIEQQLGGKQDQFVRHHLSSCEQCRESYKFMQAILKETAQLEQLEVSDAFRASLHKKLVAASAPAARHGFGDWLVSLKERLHTLPEQFNHWGVYGTAAAGIFLITVSVIALKYTPPQELPENGGSAIVSPTPYPSAPLNIDPNVVSGLGEQPSEPGTQLRQPENTVAPDVPAAKTDSTPSSVTNTATAEPTVPATEIPSAYPAAPTAAASATAAPSGGDPAPAMFGVGNTGSGGQSRISVSPASKVQHITVVTFTAEECEAAKQLLNRYELTDGYYTVSANAAESIVGSLSALPGFVALAAEEKDWSGEYDASLAEAASLSAELAVAKDAAVTASLQNQLNRCQEKMDAITARCGKGYIQLVIQ